MNTFKFISIFLIVIGIGCTKKVTKIDPVPEPYKPPIVVQDTLPPPVVEQVPDIDSQLREVLQVIYFDFDKYDLQSDAINILEKIAIFIKDHKTVRLLVEGFCDEHGSSNYNMELGENRAKAVKKNLISYGVVANRIETVSYGKERQVKTNCGTDDNCSRKNRRVEWKVIAK